MEIQKGKVFISYRREGGIDIARSVLSELEKRGYKVFLDLESLGAGKFNDALLHEIETSSNFVLILSPGSLERCINQGDWVRTEVGHAMKKGINIVPIIVDKFDYPKNLPSDIRGIKDINAVKWSNEYFSACISKLETFFVEKQPREDVIKVQPQSELKQKSDVKNTPKKPIITNKNNKKVIWKIGGGIFSFVALLIISVLFFMNRDKVIVDMSAIETYGNTSGNLCNKGLSNKFGTTANGSRLNFLNRINDEWGYWYDTKTQELKVKQNDEESEVLLEQNKVSYFLVTPEWFYYTVGESTGTLYRAPRLEENEKSQQMGDVEEVLMGIAMENHIIIEDNKVYYCKEGKGIYSYDIAKEKEKIILEEETTWDFSFVGKHDKWLYILDKEEIWRVNITGDKKETIFSQNDFGSDLKISNANVDGSLIYVILTDAEEDAIEHTDSIYSLRLDGTEKKRIYTTESINQNIDVVNVCGESKLYVQITSGNESCFKVIRIKDGSVMNTDPDNFSGFSSEIIVDKGNSIGNLCNMGFVTRADKKSRYIGNQYTTFYNRFCEEYSYYYNSVNGYIWFSYPSEDGNKSEILLENIDCRYLYANPEWIVYVAVEDGIANLYRAENKISELTIGEPQVLATDIIAENSIIIMDGLIYYWKLNEGLYSINLNSKEDNLRYQLQEGENCKGWHMYDMQEDTVYYFKNNSLYWLSLETGNKGCLAAGNNYYPDSKISSVIKDGNDTYIAVHYDDAGKTDEIWKKTGSESPQFYLKTEMPEQCIKYLNFIDSTGYAWIEEHGEVKTASFELTEESELQFR